MAPKPVVRSHGADEGRPVSGLGQIAQAQQEAAAESPFLSTVLPRMQILDQLTSVREAIPKRIQELTRARARQMTAEQNADRALEALVALFDPPDPMDYEDEERLAEMEQRHSEFLASPEDQAEMVADLAEQAERSVKAAQGIAAEINGSVVDGHRFPGLVDTIIELGVKRSDLEKAAAAEMDKEIPQFEENPEAAAKLEQIQQTAWDSARSNPDVIKIDDDDEDEDEEEDLNALIQGMPKE